MFIKKIIYRFGCLLTTLQLTPSTINRIVMTCAVLHNLMQDRYPNQANANMDIKEPNNHNIIPGAWRDNNIHEGLDAAPGNTSSKVAKQQRDYMRTYYSSPVGQVP